jgi:hypothetical protein
MLAASKLCSQLYFRFDDPKSIIVGGLVVSCMF